MTDRYRTALEAILREDYPRPVGTPISPDGQPSKHDRCTHGIWMYEPCQNCLDAYIQSVFAEDSET